LFGHGIGLVGIDAEIGHRFGHRAAVDAALVRQCLQRGDDDGLGVDLEVMTKRRAAVAASEAVGPERDVATGYPLPNLIGDELHVVGRGDERTLRARETLGDVAYARLVVRVTRVPALHVERLAAQLAEARDAP